MKDRFKIVTQLPEGEECVSIYRQAVDGAPEMKLSCPNCGHVACNLCAKRTATGKIPSVKDKLGVLHGEPNISCHACKVSNAQQFWTKGGPEKRPAAVVDTQGDFWK